MGRRCCKDVDVNVVVVVALCWVLELLVIRIPLFPYALLLFSPLQLSSLV